MPKRRGLTPRQREVLDWIVKFLRENGYPPTIREVASRFSVHYNAARKHLLALQREGALRLNSGRARGIALAPRGATLSVAGVTHIPIIGRVSAGQPIFAVENWEGTLLLDSDIANGDAFVVRVKGDSMKDVGILDGDLAIVKPQPTAERGEVVCVLMQSNGEPEVTLKGYFPERNGVRLQPANPNYNPIFIPKSSSIEWQILGKVVGIVRKGVPRMKLLYT